MEKFVKHTIAPFYHKDSKVLILGTMPSPKSREEGFYYAHPQNRFWRIVGDLFNSATPKTVLKKQELLQKNKIALWDVLQSCEIVGASDSSIKNPVANDISFVLQTTEIQKIFTTGKKAYDLYRRYCEPQTKMEAILLPSTSPANCRMNYDTLLQQYQKILDFL